VEQGQCGQGMCTAGDGWTWQRDNLMKPHNPVQDQQEICDSIFQLFTTLQNKKRHNSRIFISHTLHLSSTVIMKSLLTSGGEMRYFDSHSLYFKDVLKEYDFRFLFYFSTMIFHSSLQKMGHKTCTRSTHLGTVLC